MKPHTKGPAADAVPSAVLTAWNLTGDRVEAFGAGLINGTWRVDGPAGPRVLQRVNPIFPPGIHANIAAVTRHLRARGLAAPELLPTRDGQLCLEAGGHVWRLMSLLPGASRNRLESPEQARAAGGLLARFHGALADLRHDFGNLRVGVHDTPRHLANLRQAVAARSDHRQHAAVAAQADEILARIGDVAPLTGFAPRIVHGDPKVNNILFSADGRTALSLIDLDTLGPMPLPLELGDAFRSWCNPGGEDEGRAEFSVPLFAAAVEGYAEQSRPWITLAEARAIVPATLTIYLELAARFAADALNESYFGWDPTRFPGRGEHNLARAASQLAAAASLQAQERTAEAVVTRAFGGA